MRRSVIIILAGLGCVTAPVPGDEFVNLTFDEPDLSHALLWRPPMYGSSVAYRLYAPVEEAFRGWTLVGDFMWEPYEGMVCVQTGGTPFALMASTLGPPYGAYIVYVNDTYIWSYVRPEFSLAQIGKVPEELSALFFYVTGGPPDTFEPIHFFVNGAEQEYLDSPYGCPMVDFSPFAGQQVELKLVFPAAQIYDFDIFGFGPMPGAPTPVIIRHITARDGQVILSWTGPSPRYQVQQKPALDLPWENVGAPVTQTNWTNAVTAPLGFFRVVGLPE